VRTAGRISFEDDGTRFSYGLDSGFITWSAMTPTFRMPKSSPR